MELLVRVIDRDGDLATKAGDVIAAYDDGFQWNPGERHNPSFQILRVPLVASEVEALLMSEIDPVRGVAVAMRRYGLNLEALGIRPVVADAMQRAYQQALDCPTPEAQIAALHLLPAVPTIVVDRGAFLRAVT